MMVAPENDVVCDIVMIDGDDHWRIIIPVFVAVGIVTLPGTKIEFFELIVKTSGDEHIGRNPFDAPNAGTQTIASVVQLVRKRLV